jgi:hypothetical protein
MCNLGKAHQPGHRESVEAFLEDLPAAWQRTRSLHPIETHLCFAGSAADRQCFRRMY